MASTVTLANLIFRAQSRADMINAEFASTAEWTVWANNAASDLYDSISQADPERYLSSVTSTLTPPATSIALPTDFYKLLRVDLLYGAGTPAQFYTLRKFNLLEEDAYQFPAYMTLMGPAYRYRLRADTLDFAPAPQMSCSIRMLYLPILTQMTTGTDTLDVVNGWDDMVVLDMAITALLKENATDVSPLMAERAKFEQRIKMLAAERDTSFPEQTIDVTRGPFSWGGGGTGMGGL